MTTTRRGYVFGTFLSSCAALVMLIVACSSNVWIDSQVTPVNGNLKENYVNYGLFRGSYEKELTMTNRITFDLSVVCDFGENVCEWSCLADSEQRQKELEQLLKGEGSGTCTRVGTLISPTRTSRRNFTSRENGESPNKEVFMNAGLYLSAVLMLMLALVGTAIAALLAVLNTASNPRRWWMATGSLRYWNAGAGGLDLLCLILWGTLYATGLSESIALNEVINGTYSTDKADLGWSYWMVFIALVINVSNIGVLEWRDYLIKREPPPPTYNPEKEVADGTIFLY